MTIELRQECIILEAWTTLRTYTLMPGIYELVSVVNPIDPAEERWLVLPGTRRGASEWWWRNKSIAMFIEPEESS